MKRFIEGEGRGQVTMLPECLDDYIGEDNPVRVIDLFVDGLELSDLGFHGDTPAATGRPGYHPSLLLKIYIYGYLNRIQSSRRLDQNPGKMKQRRSTVEHVFGTLKFWMGSAHFLMKTLKHVGTEMSLHVLSYKLRRVLNILGVEEMMKAIRMVAI